MTERTAPTQERPVASEIREALASETLSQAAIDVLAERRRQVEVEGWTPQHDDTHESGELAKAAACYAARGRIYYAATSAAPFMRYPRQGRNREPTGPYLQVAEVWPFEEPIKSAAGDRRRDLVKASALIIAEIERLDRASNQSQMSDTSTDEYRS